MMEDNTLFEIMIHTMELSVVVGIAVTVWYIKKNTKKPDESHDQQQQNENPGSSRR